MINARELISHPRNVEALGLLDSFAGTSIRMAGKLEVMFQTPAKRGFIGNDIFRANRFQDLDHPTGIGENEGRLANSQTLDGGEPE